MEVCIISIFSARELSECWCRELDVFLSTEKKKSKKHNANVFLVIAHLDCNLSFVHKYCAQQIFLYVISAKFFFS